MSEYKEESELREDAIFDAITAWGICVVQTTIVNNTSGRGQKGCVDREEKALRHLLEVTLGRTVSKLDMDRVTV